MVMHIWNNNNNQCNHNSNMAKLCCVIMKILLLHTAYMFNLTWTKFCYTSTQSWKQAVVCWGKVFVPFLIFYSGAYKSRILPLSSLKSWRLLGMTCVINSLRHRNNSTATQTHFFSYLVYLFSLLEKPLLL